MEIMVLDLSKNKASSQTNDAQAFQNLRCKYTILLMLFYYLGDYLRLVFADLNAGIIHKCIAFL